MKTIKELRSNLPDKINLIGSSIRYFSTLKIDYDVFMPTKNKNLQRGFVWTLGQKRELIWSMLYARQIPPMSFIQNIDETWEIIDGKQRLSTFIDFYNNKFTIEIENIKYYFKDLPKEYAYEINNFHFRYYVIDEMIENEYSDDFKQNWFNYINFSGTPQESTNN